MLDPLPVRKDVRADSLMFERFGRPQFQSLDSSWLMRRRAGQKGKVKTLSVNLQKHGSYSI